jgi:hypothetical protein
MSTKLRTLLLACALLLLGASPQNKADQAKKEALDAAESWLKLVDQGQYEASWKQGAEYFKNAIPLKQWRQTIKATRKPLGKTLSREVISTDYKTALPGAPDGEYVVIQFKTSFEFKQHSVETVTPKLGKDNNWRVSGYYIK